MTVTAVQVDKRSGVRTSEHALDSGQITRRHTEVFRVTTDGNDDTEQVLNSPAVKQIFHLFPSDTAARVTNVKCTSREENNKEFNVAVQFSTAASGSEEEEDPDPLNASPDVTWASTAVNVVAEKDRDGEAILNKAGDAFDPPVEVERPHAVLTVSQNEASFSGAIALQYVQKVNSTTFEGAAAGEVMCRSISAVDETKNNIQYWRVTYEFEFAPEGWQPEILEQGLRDTNGDPLKGDDGDDVTTPVPIDTLGDRIPKSSLPESAIFTVFNVYNETDFNAIGLVI